MIVYADRVVFDNPCVPNGHGPIDPKHFTPRSKNPPICKFMIQMGRYEELGSGICNVNKYLPFFADGALPVFDEGDTFTTIVPLVGPKKGTDHVTTEVTTVVTPQVTPQVERVLLGLRAEMTRRELQTVLGLADRMHFQSVYLDPSLSAGLVEMTIPERPNSRLQKYRLTEKGKLAAKALLADSAAVGER